MAQGHPPHPMKHQDHVHLLRRGVPAPGGCWADFGSGEGAFTLALRELAGPEAELYSVEKERSRLEQQERNFRAMFPPPEGAARLRLIQGDFTRPLDLPPLDGFVMANSLHFFRDKEGLLRRLRGYLKPGGRLLLVEYNVDRGNPWVPHPLSFPSFRTVAARAGFSDPELLATVPSHFLREIYSALALARE